MSFWTRWRRQPKDNSVNQNRKPIERAWLSFVEEENLLRNDKESLDGQGRVAKAISDIVQIISHEEQSGARRESLQYALDYGLFTKIAHTTRRYRPVFIREALAAFEVLIKSDEDIMSNPQVVQSVSLFLSELSNARGNREFEEQFTEMLFLVASRLRKEPHSWKYWIRSSDSSSGVHTPEQGEIDAEAFFETPIQKTEEIAEEDMPEMVFELPIDTSALSTEATNTTTATSATTRSEELVAAGEQSLHNEAEAFTPVKISREVSFSSSAMEYTSLQEVSSSIIENSTQSDNNTEQATRNNQPPEMQSGIAVEVDNSKDESNTRKDDTHIDSTTYDRAAALDNVFADIPDTPERKPDLPLFFYLLDFIHQDGRSGEFARTGLLCIFESAGPGTILESWILESDFATLIASGLGALYSQLSRTMIRAFQTDMEPKIVTMARESERKVLPSFLNQDDSEDPSEIESNRAHLRMFLSYLEFLQDILSHCKSEHIKRTLLENFDTLFLHQLLIPSLSESTENETAKDDTVIAVLTYIRAIFESLEEHLILDLILPSLIRPLELEDENKDHYSDFSSIAEKNAMNSSGVLFNKTSFNLTELIIRSLDSHAQQVVCAALRLISTLLQKHYPYLLNTLFQVDTISEKFKPTITPLNVYMREMDFFLSLMPDYDTDILKSQQYESYLKDCRYFLESHRYFPACLSYTGLDESEYMDMEVSNMFSHKLKPDDCAWQRILLLLRSFFSNSVELNLILTRVFVDLMSCGWTSLRGWFLINDGDIQVRSRKDASTGNSITQINSLIDDNDDDDDDDDDDIQLCSKDLDQYNSDLSDDEYWFAKPSDRYLETSFRNLSPMMTTLEYLKSRLDEYKSKVSKFDEKLLERRMMLQDNQDKVVIAEDSDSISTSDKIDITVENSVYPLSPGNTQQRAELLFMSKSMGQSATGSVRQSSDHRRSGYYGQVRYAKSVSALSPAAQKGYHSSMFGESYSLRKGAEEIGHRRSASVSTEQRQIQATSSPFEYRLPTAPMQTRLSRPLVRKNDTYSPTKNQSFDFEYDMTFENSNNSFVEFASSLGMNDDIREFNMDNDDDKGNDKAKDERYNRNDDGNADPLVSMNRKSSKRLDTGIEMDEIVTDNSYIPAIIQVASADSGKRHYVSLTHLLGNVIVFEVSVSLMS
ncbi:Retinoic acid induced 16-like protein-domain-containing protein [Dipodascopsis uninucleata]